jgi:uncharacterized protein (DUF924 family)
MDNEKYLAIINYWFGALDSNGFASQEQLKLWFMGGASADIEIKEKFGEEVELALAGGLTQWEQSPVSLLALVILLDQFTRNVYRGSAKAFAGDSRACHLVAQAISKNWDDVLGPSYCAFLYMPLEHSEDIALQRLSVDKFRSRYQKLADAVKPRFESFVDSAVEHCEIIEKFGRFPHRNQVMNRCSSAAEIAYLDADAPRFGQ